MCWLEFFTEINNLKSHLIPDIIVMWEIDPSVRKETKNPTNESRSGKQRGFLAFNKCMALHLDESDKKKLFP